MSIDEARDWLLTMRDKATVLYCPLHDGGRCASPERGIITQVSDTWAFVRFGTDRHSKATNPADLERLPG